MGQSYGFPAENAGAAGIAALSSTALSAMRTKEEIRNLKSTNKNIEQDTKKKLEETRDAHESIYRTHRQGLLHQTQEESEQRRRDIMSQDLIGRRVEGDIDSTAYGVGLRYADRAGGTIGNLLQGGRLGTTARHNRWIRDGN